METVKIIMEITHCHQCPFHKVVHDPDPTDSFCYDDESILCTKLHNDNNAKYWMSEKLFEHKAISISNRPYQTKNIEIPSICPFKTK